jgi:hypothetical protein
MVKKGVRRDRKFKIYVASGDGSFCADTTCDCETACLHHFHQRRAGFISNIQERGAFRFITVFSPRADMQTLFEEWRRDAMRWTRPLFSACSQETR